MKKSLLLLLAAASFGTAQAQKMGDVFVYGGLGYNQDKQDVRGPGITNGDYTNTRTFTATPGIGYQFDKNFAVGVQLDMLAGKVTTYDFSGFGNKIETDTSGTAIGLFVRYTKNLSPLFFVYGQLNGNYLRSNSILRVDGTKIFEVEGNGFGVSIMPAIGINLSRRVSVIGSFGTIGYKRLVENEADDNSGFELVTNKINTTFGNDFRLTVQFNLGQRRMRTRREPMNETRNMDRYRDDANDADDREEAPMRRRRGRMDNRRMDRDDN